MMDVNCEWQELLCNQTSVDEITVIQKPPLISNELKQQLEIYIHVFSFAIPALCAMIANVINIIVYWKHGLRESIIVGFFALSLSDFIVAISTLASASCYAAKALLPNSNIDFKSIHFVTFAALRKFSYSLSCVITTYMAVERCCCVMLPFKVKTIFTRSRTIVILVSFTVFHVVCHLTYVTTHRLKWLPQDSGNGTVAYRLRITFTAYRDEILHVINGINCIFTPSASQVVVTICVVLLIKGLRQSSKFRKVVTKSHVSRQFQDHNKAENVPVTSLGDPEGKDKTDNRLDSRDARLAKTMIFLVIILSTCNIPLLMITYAQRIDPDLDIGGAYMNTYSLCYSFVYVLAAVSATVNIFVYYRNSTRYRDIFKDLFGWK